LENENVLVVIVI